MECAHLESLLHIAQHRSPSGYTNAVSGAGVNERIWKSWERELDNSVHYTPTSVLLSLLQNVATDVNVARSNPPTFCQIPQSAALRGLRSHSWKTISIFVCTMKAGKDKKGGIHSKPSRGPPTPYCSVLPSRSAPQTLSSFRAYYKRRSREICLPTRGFARSPLISYHLSGRKWCQN